MIERRKLLKSLATFPALFMAQKVTLPESVKDIPKENWGTHKDWFYYWRGWVALANQDVLVGCWIASRPDKPLAKMVYSSYPGRTLPYYKGYMFDTMVLKGQEYPTSATPSGKLDEYKESALRSLTRYIDENEEALDKA